jgi:hypothetical protein
MCDSDLAEFANALDCIAQCFYFSLQGCMVTQVHVEIKHRREPGGRGAGSGSFTKVADAVPVEEMERY